MINTTIENTKQAIVDIINNCELPPAVIELILLNIANEVNQIKIKAILNEQKEIGESSEN